MPPLLEAKEVSKHFGAVQALTKVDFEVNAGEVMALVGDNGAGKSTLIKCIAGIYPFDEGQLFFDGKLVQIHTPRDSAALGIEVVYQDLALADNLDVVGNMFLGRERLAPPLPAITIVTRLLLAPWLAPLVQGPLRRLKLPPFWLDETSMELASIETLSSLSVTTLRSVRQPVAGLSGGQRQAIAVAKAVMWNSRLVVLDEPTAALGVAQTAQVLALVRRLAEKGLGVVLISHNLHDVFEAADRITVLRLGHRVNQFVTSQTNQEEVVHAITAGTLERVPGMKEAE